jgi:Activator of Hsp90 ATPase homolog 1-like protein
MTDLSPIRRSVSVSRDQAAAFRRFQWGRVLEFEAPRRVKFTWHPSRDAATAQQVGVRFEPEGRGTRVELISDQWENWGKGARRARRGYDVGWGYVLNVWAERRTGRMALLDALAVVFRGVEIVRGGRQASIARAGGEMPRASADAGR